MALTYGRYGAKVMLVDPTGLRWTTPTVIYNGPGSGYVDMKELPNGNFCFVYDQSSFYPPSWNGSVPAQYVYNNDQSGNLKSAILSIQQQGSTDDYHWASEYHGDVSPDTLATPWSKAQSGTTNQYLWADQGQDYLRIDTTATSNAATLNYSLPGSNTPWQGISFSKGAVIDLRARAGSSGTTQGSADVLMGDGVNGYAILQLTGSSVILQGAGGTGSQASYTSAAHSGYLSTDWHNYRVIISPDPTNSGIVTAKVYLDGNYTTPILTKLLTASGLDLLRVGDESSSANGIFDVDYLRFSDRWGQWNVDGDGSFSSLANWSATTPTGVDATANFHECDHLAANDHDRRAYDAGPYQFQQRQSIHPGRRDDHDASQRRVCRYHADEWKSYDRRAAESCQQYQRLRQRNTDDRQPFPTLRRWRFRPTRSPARSTEPAVFRSRPVTLLLWIMFVNRRCP